MVAARIQCFASAAHGRFAGPDRITASSQGVFTEGMDANQVSLVSEIGKPVMNGSVTFHVH